MADAASAAVKAALARAGEIARGTATPKVATTSSSPTLTAVPATSDTKEETKSPLASQSKASTPIAAVAVTATKWCVTSADGFSRTTEEAAIFNGTHEKILAAARTIIDAKPSSSTSDSATVTRARCHVALALLQLRRFDEAMKMMDDVLQHDDTAIMQPRVLVARAAALHYSRRSDEALAMMELAMMLPAATAAAAAAASGAPTIAPITEMKNGEPAAAIMTSIDDMTDDALPVSEDANVWRLKGVIFAALGRETPSFECLRRAQILLEDRYPSNDPPDMITAGAPDYTTATALYLPPGVIPKMITAALSSFDTPPPPTTLLSSSSSSSSSSPAVADEIAAKASASVGVAVPRYEDNISRRVASLAWPLALQIAMVLSRLGRPETALEMHQAILIHREHTYESRLGVVRYQLAIGDHQSAEDMLHILLAEWPSHQITGQYLAVLFAIIGKRQAALDALAQYATPTDAVGWIVRGWAQRLLALLPDALASIYKGMELTNNTTALLQATYILRRQRRWAEAITFCDRALEMEPDDAAVYMQKGDTLNELFREDEAKVCWELGIAAERRFCLTSSASAFRVADLLAHLQRYDQALASYNVTLKLSPGHASALHNRGLLLRRMGRFDDALADMHECLKRDPDDPVVWCNIGRINENLHDLDKALEAYSRSLDLRPDSTLVLINRAQLLYRRRRFDQAMTDVRRSLELLPNDPAAITLRARVHEVQSRRDEALADYQLVARLAPNDVYAQLRLADYLVTLRRFDEAMTALSSATKLPDHATVASYWRVRAMALRGLLRYDEALEAMNQALVLEPDDAWTRARRLSWQTGEPTFN